MNQKTVAIVGGGQLGRMLVEAAKIVDLKTVVLDPTPNSPASKVADKQVVGDYKSEKDIKSFSKYADYLTLEIESANADALINLRKKGKKVNPSGQTLKIIQDKYQQKVLLKKNDIPTADFKEINIETDIEDVIKNFNFPFVLKAKMHAFDGRGNALVKNKSQIKKSLSKLNSQNIYAEKFIPFKKELAIQFVKSGKSLHIFPLVETVQKNNICHKVVAPAQVSTNISKKATQIAKKVAKLLKGNGVFAIEMFLTKKDEVLVNELAPRVHNSGHYTIEACNYSQFEQHIRAVCDLPVKSTKMKYPAAAMINILGTRNGPAKLKGLESAQKIKDVFVHIYGKEETRLERKMGHITALGKNPTEALKKAEKARQLISI